VIPIHLPPLRERPEDIPLLARHFLQHFNRKMNREIEGFAPEVMQALMLYRWPGNVRELANAVERAVALTPSGDITPQSLLLGNEETPRFSSRQQSLNEAREEFDRAYLTQLLSATRGNVSRAAAMAGRYRAEFYKLLRKYALDPAVFKEADKESDRLGGNMSSGVPNGIRADKLN
jgi:two-component system response regulator GlrR